MDPLFILIVEDDRDLVKIIKKALEDEGFRVTCAEDGKFALELIRQEMPSLLILDIMLPGKSGLKVCQELRDNPLYNQMPILFLSALNSSGDIISGLNYGADDYIPKPFHVRELTARVRVLMRRQLQGRGSVESVLTVGELILDSLNYTITTPGSTQNLTATEHRLLRYLMERPNQVISAAQLLGDVWEYPPNAGDNDLVRSHIRKLRQKIETTSRNPQYIHTIHGVGYTLTGTPSN